MAEGRINLALPTSPRSATEVDKGSLLQNAFVEDESGNKLAVKRAGLEVGMEASTTGLHRGIWFDSEKGRFVFVNEGFTLSPIHFSSLKPWNPVKTYPPASVVEGPLKTPGGSKGKPLPDGDWEDGRDPNLVFSFRVSDQRWLTNWKWTRESYQAAAQWNSFGNEIDEIQMTTLVTPDINTPSILIMADQNHYTSSPSQEPPHIKAEVIVYVQTQYLGVNTTYPLIHWYQTDEIILEYPLIEKTPIGLPNLQLSGYTLHDTPLNPDSLIEVFRSGNNFNVHVDGVFIRSQSIPIAYAYGFPVHRVYDTEVFTEVVFGNARVL